MKVLLETDQGTSEVDVDFELESLTLREQVRLERELGEETFDLLMSGKAPMRPSIIQAFVFVKLKTLYPSLEIDSFDLDLTQLVEVESNPLAEPSSES